MDRLDPTAAHDTAGSPPVPDTLAALLAPQPVDAFLAEVRHKKPLLIKGGADKLAGVMGWTVLSDLLSQTSIWSYASLNLVLQGRKLQPPEYCSLVPGRDGGQVWRPDMPKLKQWVRRGATIVANDIDNLTPALRAVSAAFESALEAKVQMNLYCSWQAHQGFGSHFDTHEVFALHVAGRKTWRLYEASKIEAPINHPAFKSMGDEWHEKNKGALTQEITMEPGDVLYIPRGWYHDALASSEGTIHVAVGVNPAIGLDAVGVFTDRAVHDPLFRQALPLSRDRSALAAHLAALGDRLAEIARDPKVLDAFADSLAAWGYPREGIDLPGDATPAGWKMTAPGLKVTQTKQGWVMVRGQTGVPIPPGWEKPVAWIVARDRFDEATLSSEFPALSDDARADLLAKLSAMKVIARE